MNHDALSIRSPEDQTPDYGYTNGLQINRHIYGGSNPSHAKHATSYEAIHDSIALPEHIPNQDRIVSKLGSTALEWCHVRSAKDASTVNIVLMGWAGDNDNPITQDALRYHVAHNPHADIMHINNPAHGESTRLPRSVSKHIAKTGHFGAQGELHAQLINKALQDYDHVNISGHSYGGRQALALAAALDRPVDNLHLFDPPGSRNLGGLKGIANAFMTLEGKHAGLYGKHAPDQAAASIQRQGDSTPLRDILRLIRRKGFAQQFFDQTAAMSKDGLEHDLALASRNVLNTLRFTSPELSELNYVGSVAGILDRVATADRVIQHDIVIGHTHSMIASNPNILAYLHRSGA